MPGVDAYRLAASILYNDGPTSDPWIILTDTVHKSNEFCRQYSESGPVA